MIEEREELMLSPHQNGEGICTLRNAHFLKPTLETNTPFPKHPCISLTSKSHISLLKTLISFNCKSQSQTNWVTWVNTMTQTHQKTWQKVGIFDAIKATTYRFRYHYELIIGLAEKWNPETNTFIFPFGEATITLEDIMILGGYSVLGECVTTLTQTEEVEQIKQCFLSSFVTNDSNGFSDFMGLGGELEHIAFLVFWLSRYVFPLQRYNKNNYICPHVFPIAVALARGTTIALAPAILAAIYRDLRLLKAKIVDFVSQGNDNGSKLVLSAPFQLLQWWVWERFTVLSPKPASSPCGEPRVARWPKFRKTRVSVFSFEFESLGECFLWKPYALYVTNKEFYEFYHDEGKKIVVNSELELSDGLVSFARCLRPCELVGLDTIEQYLPHRVGMQFGFDQDIPCPVSRCNQSVEDAWSSYTKPLDGEVLCLLPRLLRGEVSTRYSDWWKTESYYCCNIQIRRSERIANIRSQELNVISTMQHEKRAIICLSSESSFVSGGQEMHIEKSPSEAIYVNDCENGDNCDGIRVEVVHPLPSQTDIPKSSDYYISSADGGMDIANANSEIIPSPNGTRAGDSCNSIGVEVVHPLPSQTDIPKSSDYNSSSADGGMDIENVGSEIIPSQNGTRAGDNCNSIRVEVVRPSPSQSDISYPDGMDIEITPAIPNTCHVHENVDTEIIPSQNGTRAGDNCNSIRGEVVPPSPSQSDIPKSSDIPKNSEYYISSADGMNIEATPTAPKCHFENVDFEIIPSQNGTRAADIFEDAPPENLKRVTTFDLPSEDNNAASDVGCSKQQVGKKLVFLKQTVRNGSECDPLFIEDDENDNEDKRVKAIKLICSEFEGRICNLEAKFKASRSNGGTAY